MTRLLRRLGAFLLVAGAAWIVLAPVEGLADEDNIPDQVVVVGQSLVIPVPYEYGDVALGSSAIDGARRDDSVIVYGRKRGETNLLIYDTDYVLRDDITINVIPANLSKVMQNVQTLLLDIEGISYDIIGDMVYIRGEVATDGEARRIADLATREPLVNADMVKISAATTRVMAQMIKTDIDHPGIDARVINGEILIEGVVHSEAAKERAIAIAQAYYPRILPVIEVREVDRVPGRTETVVIIVHYVELAKSLTQSWGIEWQPLAITEGLQLNYEAVGTWSQGGADANGWGDVTGEATATISSFLPRLDRARNAGYARVLENPTISVKSGQPASIFSGMEYPYLVSEGLVNTIEFKDIGIRLDVTPYAQGNDVDMDINVDVTALGEPAPNGYETITKSTLATSEYCRAGESIVIGGLQRVNDTTIYNRVPPTSIEGGLVHLYANKDYKKSKNQFLVFLTPQIHEDSAAANQEIKDQFNLEEVRQ